MIRRCLLIVTACIGWASAQSPLESIRFEPIAEGLAFPTYVTHAGDGSGRLFILERAGRVLIHDGRDLLPAPFLDIRDRVTTGTRLGDERGLLGIAFHPQFAANGFFFVHYSGAGGQTVLSRFSVTADPNTADPGSEVRFFAQPQPFGNHNGGQVAFGPDGRLYLGLGDGGSRGDPGDRAQNRTVLLGKILRFDVEQGAPARPAAGNPFLSDPNARDEIWSYGWRNPWRFSFDRATGDLWVADVGQNAVEEVSLEPAGGPGGGNYGWRLMEGPDCFNPATGCNDGSLILPVLEYRHAVGRCSITGGYVYRGGSGANLQGRYFFGDYCTGEIWAAENTDSGWSAGVPRETSFRISSFGEDEAGELYVVDLQGTVYRMNIPGPEPRLSSAGVVNAASFQGGAGLAPGSILSLFGEAFSATTVSASSAPLPSSLAGIRIRIGGVDAPLFFVSPSQANIQAPWEVAGPSAAVVVMRGSAQSAPVDIPVATANPGLFSMDQSGAGQGAILVSGAGVAAPSGAFPSSRPARIGESLEIYATGLGRVAGGPVSGAATPPSAAFVTLAEPSVRVGVEPARVLFSGLAPGFVGVYQVNVQLVGDFPSGDAVPLTLSIDGAESNTVTIAIE